MRVLQLSLAVVMVLCIGIVLVSDDGVSYSQTLPVITIDTEGSEPIESKEVYVDCTISVSGAGEGQDLDDENGKIRGRGNTSWNQPSYWTMPKKSYRVSFDQPVALFGNAAATDWTLIANYVDQSLCRNLFAYSVAAGIDSPYTTSTQCASLCLNGIYQGMYLVCEQVEIGPGRVGDTEDTIDADPGKTNYLLERFSNNWDGTEGEEGKDYFVSHGDFFAVDGVGHKRWTQAHFDYIRDYADRVETAIEGDDWSAVQAVADTDSFARTYVVNELFHNRDVAGASLFYYKPAGGLLKSGPVWDFDNSSGNGTNLKNKTPDSVWAGDENKWYSQLLEFPEFREQVAGLLEQYGGTIRDTISSGVSFVFDHPDDFKKNFDKWPILGALVGSNSLESMVMDEWEDHVEYVRDWLYESLSYMERNFLG